jgi:hypothetical protein
VAYPGIFFGGGGSSTNSVEDRGQRERGSGDGSPLLRGSAQFAVRFDFVKLSGCLGLLRMYFPRNWEFGSALSKLRNFRGGLNPRNPPPLGTQLLSVGCHLVTDVLGQPIGQGGTDRLSRNVGYYQSRLRNIPEERLSHLLHGGSRKPHKRVSAVVLFLW